MKQLLRLVRFSLAPSLLADAAAGCAWLAEGQLWSKALLMAVPASLLLFVGGMALNARVDVVADAKTRPDRPLPSGSLPLWCATGLAIVGLLAAPVLGLLLQGPGSWSLWLLMMAGLVAAYHTPLRRNPCVGPLLLGSIRGANLLSAAVLLVGPMQAWRAAWLPAVCYAGYVAGASLVAHQEDRKAKTSWVNAGVLLAFLSTVSLYLGAIFQETSVPSWMWIVAGVISLWHWWPLYQRLRAPQAWAEQPGGIGALAGLLLSRMALFCTVACLLAGMLNLALISGLAFLCIRWLVRFLPPT